MNQNASAVSYMEYELGLDNGEPLIYGMDGYVALCQGWAENLSRGKSSIIKTEILMRQELAQIRTLNADLLEACKALFELVESGQLVRNISEDAKPEWAIRQVGFVKTLSQAKAAITKATQETESAKRESP